VLDYDIREDELHREAMARGRREMRERHVKLGMLLQSISAHALAEWQAKLAAGTPLNLSAGEITQLMEVGSKLERLARGEDRDSKFTKIIMKLATERTGSQAMGIRRRAETGRRAEAMGPTKTGRHSELVARVPRRGIL